MNSFRSRVLKGLLVWFLGLLLLAEPSVAGEPRGGLTASRMTYVMAYGGGVWEGILF